MNNRKGPDTSYHATVGEFAILTFDALAHITLPTNFNDSSSGNSLIGANIQYSSAFPPIFLPHLLRELPGKATNSMEPDKISEIRRMHECYSHPSIIEVKRMSGEWFKDFDVTPQVLDKWNELEGKFCTGCTKGGS